MSQTISSQININQKLSMRQIMNLFQISKDYDGSIYFICKNRAVEPERLAKLVSFMLTLEDCTELKIKVEGPDCQKIMQQISTCCKGDGFSEEQLNFTVQSNRKIRI